VVPVNFAVHDRQVVVRVGSGTLADSVIGRLVAFETDDLNRATGQAWSVQVRGLASAAEQTGTLDASHLPHPLVPRPGHTIIVVRPDVVSGRRFSLEAQGGGGDILGS
jgi:uncharacterized protein